MVPYLRRGWTVEARYGYRTTAEGPGRGGPSRSRHRPSEALPGGRAQLRERAPRVARPPRASGTEASSAAAVTANAGP